MIKRTALITVVGRPNVGKSTLVNAMVGEKVSIVTPKPQTTRNRIFGVAERGETQLVFADTPGFHRARTKLGDYMVHVVEESVEDDVDALCLVVEPRANIGRQEEGLIAKIKAAKAPSVLVINKIDTVEKPELLFDELEKFAKEDQQLFPEDMITDQTTRQMCAEIIREKLLLKLQSEVPHGTAVEITTFTEREDGVTEITATIYCEKESHKGIIIGKQGEMLKAVGELARRDMERLLESKVYLNTWVKVKENWRDYGANLKTFGYTE